MSNPNTTLKRSLHCGTSRDTGCQPRTRLPEIPNGTCRGQQSILRISNHVNREDRDQQENMKTCNKCFNITVTVCTAWNTWLTPVLNHLPTNVNTKYLCLHTLRASSGGAKYKKIGWRLWTTAKQPDSHQKDEEQRDSKEQKMGFI